MAVAFDAQSSAVFNVSGVSTMTLNNITVGSGSNTALFFMIVWGLGASPTVSACNWDDGGTPQAMSVVTGTVGNSGVSSMSSAIYQLVAPTPGNKNLKISWTGNCEAHAVAISFTGVDQSTPSRNGGTNFKGVATAPPATITIASATGNQVIAGFEQQSALWPGTACDGNEIAQQDSGPNFGTAYSYTSGAASVSPTATWSAGDDAWVAFGCDVQAASGGGITPTDFPYWPDFTSTKSSTAAFDLQAFPMPLLPPPAPWGVKNYWIDFFKRKPQAPDLGSQAILEAVAPPPAPWGVKNYWPDFATRKPRTTDLGSQAILKAVAPPPAPWGVKNYWIDFFRRPPQTVDIGSQAILKPVAPPPAPWATEAGWPEMFRLTIERDYNGYYFVQVVTVAPDVVTFSGGLMPMMGVG